MSLERKPLYLTLDSTKQFELPNTASAVGIDLNTGKQIYYNTSSLGWVTQETFSGSNAIFGNITGSLTVINASTPYLVGSGAVILSTASNGQVKILVSQDSGFWTPAFTFATPATSPTYSSQAGSYYKIGRQVTANFTIGLSDKGTSTGDISLVGLPFTSDTGANGAGAGAGVVGAFANIAGGVNRVSSISATVGSGTTSASMYYTRDVVTDALRFHGDNLTNTTQLTGSITYISAT